MSHKGNKKSPSTNNHLCQFENSAFPVSEDLLSDPQSRVSSRDKKNIPSAAAASRQALLPSFISCIDDRRSREATYSGELGKRRHLIIRLPFQWITPSILASLLYYLITLP